MLKLSRLQLRVGLTGGNTIPHLPEDDSFPLPAKQHTQSTHVGGRWDQTGGFRTPEQVSGTALPLSSMSMMEKDRWKFSATLAARSVIQQQTDLMALPGAHPADEVPSKAEAGHSPPKRPEALRNAEPPAVPQQPGRSGAPLPRGQLTRRSPPGNNSAANAAMKWIQLFDLLGSHLGNGYAHVGEAAG